MTNEKQDHEKNWEKPKGFFRSRDSSKKNELLERMKAIQSSTAKPAGKQPSAKPAPGKKAKK